MNIDDYFSSTNWTIAGNLTIPARKKEVFAIDDLALSTQSKNVLNAPPYQGKIYRHQEKTVRLFLDGKNVCLATGTASGKSLAFQIAAVETLTRDPSARVMAIYPMKALGNEQTQRWRDVINKAGIKGKVGRIDGSVNGKKIRLDILKSSRVVVFTPDIIHAWLFSNLSNEIVQEFLRSVSLIIVDEVHTYTGVFGSNAAFLFRRIRHILDLFETSVQFICASATISEPRQHLQKLFGVDFDLVDQNEDTSPKHEANIQLIEPPKGSNFLTQITQLLFYITQHTSFRFITFVDSRVQVEHITSILSREKSDEDDETPASEESRLLEKLQILPYRAGYEAGDRNEIQRRLSASQLRGVVSTSALELGIDIPGLDLCILVGVPSSQTSLYQRIGRIGRHGKGHVLIIYGGDIYDRAVFANPEELLRRPPAESALYLENLYIQYIHALCLARLDGEHDQILTALHRQNRHEFVSAISWPSGFIELCRKERLGEIPVELRERKAEAGENPNYTYPLRDVSRQFTIEQKRGPEQDRLGNLSHGQLMREAYPGAVYYHLTRSYRVYRVSTHLKQILVRKEKKYTTRPQTMPIQAFPNLTEGNVFNSNKLHDLVITECNLQVRESINGFKERRGSNEENFNYPLPPSIDVIFDQPYFARTFFTTGVIVTHPVFNTKLVNCNVLAELLFEAFLMLIPYERQDINFAVDRHRSSRKPFIQEGDRFIALYDQTYGSLRLSGRFMESEYIQQIFQQLLELAKTQDRFEINLQTRKAIEQLVKSSAHASVPLKFSGSTLTQVNTASTANLVQVILPGSKGLSLKNDNQEFLIEGVRYTVQGLRYLGVLSSAFDKSAKILPNVNEIIEIPGVSRTKVTPIVKTTNQQK